MELVTDHFPAKPPSVRAPFELTSGQRVVLFNPPTGIKFDGWELLLRILIILCLGFVVYLTVVGQVIWPIVHAIEKHQWAEFIAMPSVLLIGIGSLMLCFRTFLWFRYKPTPVENFADAPPLTVIIPAYNEGPMVKESIESVASAVYPQDRLEIIVIDDGSKDDTWSHIQTAAARHPHLVKTFKQPKNRGKRAALEVGIRQARGEIVVTIDSDSTIDSTTLLSIVAPFRNPKIGAVAGKVKVLNQVDGWIPRMLGVRFILSFDFLRAAQSTYGTVYCCPGALAAYRLSVVRHVLDDWMNQRFLGVECTYGEDRAMTNLIMSAGYDSVYQSTAVVHTVVPVTYDKLCKMFLRWDRSYIREEAHFLHKVVWKRPIFARLFSSADSIITNLRHPIAYASLAMVFVLMIVDPWTIVRVCTAILLVSFLNTLYYLRSERSRDFVYGILYSYFAFFALFWVFPYAALTVRSKSWMTR